MARFDKLNSEGPDLPDKKRCPSVRKSAQSRRYQSRRRASRRLFAEPLESRILLTSVTAVNPLANSHSAPVSTDVAATFDQNINPATATPQNFVVHSMQRGQLTGSSVNVSTSGPTVTSNPTSDFFPGELVQATVTSAIQSTGGQGSDAHVWQLRTAVPFGSGTFSDSGQSLGSSISQSVSLGDVDGDADLDAVVANYGQGNRVWINQGGSQSGTAGTFSDSSQSLGNSLSFGVSLGDVDGDGDLDVFVANQGRGNRVWLNQGGLQSGTAGTFSDSGQSLGNFGSRRVSLGDVDGDGDLDAFVANRYQANHVWINQGGAQGGTAGTFSDNGQSLESFNSYSASLGDVDGDGDLDAFVANRGQPNRVWLNQGGLQNGTAGNFSDSGQSLAGPGNINNLGVSLGDVDGDGDLDAFVTGRYGDHRVWLNQGGLQSGTAGMFSDSSQSLGRITGLDVSLGDVDGDGDLDAFIGNYEDGNSVWINQGGAQSGSAGTFSDSGQSLGDSFSYGVSLGDVDGDGALDAFVANSSQAPNRVWLGIGGNKAPTLNAVSDVTINEDEAEQTVNLAGISAGTGETQPLKVIAASSNTGLISNPTVIYTSPNASGTLTFTPVADASGSATVTATVEDGGPDLDLSTTTDNATFSHTFDVTVNAVNDIPTLATISSLTINQGAPEQTVNLSGIAAGGGETQPLRVTAVSDNTGLIPNPSVTYVTPQATGTLNFTPVATASGTAIITVTVEDGGLDNDISTAAGNAKFDGTFGVTVNPAAVTTVTGLVLNGGSPNRSGLATLTFQFNEATTVDAAGSLILWNHTTGAAVDVSGATLGNNGTTAVTWNLAGIALPDGNYTATLPKAAAGLAETHTKALHVLAGDSSGNAQVDFADFGDLANGFNTAGPIFGPGDMNGDGNIDFTDFSILANNFNNILPALTLDFGDAPESGTSFPTTLANDGARHVLGSGLFLGATVDDEADGQPDANAAGDGADEDGVTFATLTAGSSAGVTVTAIVPGSAVLNAWIDFNADGDWDDAGEQVFVDQTVTNGTNSLTAAIPSGATAGSIFARFRVTAIAGYSYSGLARDGEVEDYQVTIVAAKGSSSRARPDTSFNQWVAAFAAHPSSSQTASVSPQRQAGESVWNSVEPAGPKVVDLALEEVAPAEHRPTRVRAGSAFPNEQLVDRVFEEDIDLLLLDNGSGGAI